MSHLVVVGALALLHLELSAVDVLSQDDPLEVRLVQDVEMAALETIQRRKGVPPIWPPRPSDDEVAAMAFGRGTTAARVRGALGALLRRRLFVEVRIVHCFLDLVEWYGDGEPVP